MLSMQKRILALTLASALSLVLSGCYLYPVEEEPLAPPLMNAQTVNYKTEEVKRGDIRVTITDSGTFRAVDSYDCMLGNRGGRVGEKQAKVGIKVAKGDILLSLDNTTLEAEIIRKEIYLKKAQLAYTNAKKSGDKNWKQNAAWDLELAQLELDLAKDDFEKAVVRSPIDGIITWIADINVGKWVDANTPLVTVEDPTTVSLEYRGNRTDDFAVGMKVTIEYKKKEYEGEVVSTPRSAPEDAPQWLKESVSIEVKDCPALRGEDARIIAVLKSSLDTLLVPKYVVQNYMGSRIVQVLEEDIRVQKTIEVGLETTTEVEVLSGLIEGELVIVQ